MTTGVTFVPSLGMTSTFVARHKRAAGRHAPSEKVSEGMDADKRSSIA